MLRKPNKPQETQMGIIAGNIAGLMQRLRSWRSQPYLLACRSANRTLPVHKKGA